jgi:type VI secretion system secreted protein VgrG
MPSHADSALTTLAVTAAAPLDSLFVQRLDGSEGLARLFEFRLEARSTDAALALDAAIGQHVTVTLSAGAIARPLDGLCARIEQRAAEPGFACYVLELRPWLWWLTLASDNRIFQAKNVPDIVEAVFAAYSHADYELKLTGSYDVREYCVQYRETDFAFVSRLLEEEGIFYFFRHETGRHVMVIADANDAFLPCPGQAKLAFMPPQVGGREQQAIRNGELGQQAVTTAYRSTDFAFVTPATSLFAQAGGAAPAPGVYDYPGGYATKAASDALAKKRVDALGVEARQLSGESDSRALAPGCSFTLTGHERADANVDWLITSVSHDASHEQYRNRFAAMPLTSTYRAPRVTPKPRVHGAQTAIVVGKSGEEIWTDKYGRIKVQFHWDRLGTRDENSSCWVRVAQMWAGKSWGALFIPRIRQEVVVSFLDGDADRPLVTGCVYNGDNAPPYALPADQTRTTLKSDSSKGGAGFNELRFEDKKDSEELYLHAQKDMKTEVVHDAIRTVGNDDSTTVKQNQTLDVTEGNQDITVAKGNRTTAISTGNDTLTVKGKRAVTVEGDETHVNKGDFKHTVTGNYTLTVSGNLTIEVSGAVKIKAGTSFDNEAGTALSNKAGTALVNKAGTSLTNDAGISLTNKAGASQTVDGAGMLTLKGGLIKIN